VTLADLIDLEAQLLRDREASPAALEERDRALVAGAGLDPRRRADAVRRWLDLLREREGPRLFPGAAVERALAFVRVALVATGLVLGWSAATALLSYGGGHPVNVWDVLLALVLVQILLLLFLAVSLLFPVATLGAPLFGLFRDVVGWIHRALAARAAPGSADAWRTLWHRLRSRRSLYHDVEPSLLLATTQAFGVAFNVGVLLGCLRLIVFSDVAFGWSTTLVDLDARRFRAVVAALAAPWGWAWPDAVPSLALVEATRYSRLEGAYLEAGAGRAADPALVGGWWRFLVAAIAVYGLLPRLLALLAARLRARRLLARRPLDDAEVSRLVARLVEPRVETRSPTPEAAGEEGPRAAARAPGTAPDAPAAVVLWRDVPDGAEIARLVAAHLGRRVAAVASAGGREASDWRGALDAAEPVVVVAEGFEAPDRAALRFLRDLRGAAGPRHQVLVVLVDAAEGAVRGAPEAEVAIWRDGLARLEDPYLFVEALRAGAPRGERP
jgi:hypothetical protein